MRTDKIISGSNLISCFSPQESKRKKKVGPAHIQCVNVRYDGSGPDRAHIPIHKISWLRPYPEYMPAQYTSYDVLKQPPWADPSLDSPRVAMPGFNRLDGLVDRRSYDGEYQMEEGVPRNTIGRTGMIGRGVLGRWGPNHTATPIITRWARDQGNIREVNGKRVLEVVVVRTRAGWSLPCELVTPNDRLGLSTRRTFLSELVRRGKYSSGEEASRALTSMFTDGTLIYRGYVDDAKNTDNAWLETISLNFHDEHSKTYGSFQLGEDYTWVEAHYTLNLFCQHKDWLKDVVELHRAHW